MADIDIDSIEEGLVDFGCSISKDESVISKLSQISSEFNIFGDDLVDQLIAFVNNQNKKMVDAGLLELMETDMARAAKKRKVEKVSTPKAARMPLMERVSLPTRLNNSCVESDSSFVDDEQNFTEITGKYAAFAPARTSSHNKYLSRTEKGKVVTSHKGSLYVGEDVKAVGKAKIEVISPAAAELYANDKAASVIDAKCELLAKFGEIYADAYPEITHWTRGVVASTDSIFVYGEIVREGVAGSQDRSYFHLMMDDENGSIIELDVSQVATDISLFTGKIAAFSGVNESGDRLVVQKIFTEPLLQLAPFSANERNVDNLIIWAAAGPFTSTDTCSYEPLVDLLELVRKEQPHVLVLMGPFVDRSNKFMNEPTFTETRTHVADKLMVRIAKALEGISTEVVLQPHPARDASGFAMFPATPIQLPMEAIKSYGKRVHLVSDPAVIRVSGVEIALSGSEIVAHLSRAEWHRSANQENSNRIERLEGHCLRQRSLYPLSPSLVPSDRLDALRLCSLSSAPHLLLFPSLLPPAIKDVCGSLVCNPGPLLRGSSGTFLKTSISLATVTDPSMLKESTQMQIVRI